MNNNILELLSQFTQYPSLNLGFYIALSFIYIMIYHLAINFGSEFNLFITIAFFVFGAIIGNFLSYELGFLIAVILSFVFISGPRKDL